MRLMNLALAGAALCAAVVAGSAPASATDRCVLFGGDYCTYHYEPRGYYPYYNSGYWVPAREYRRPVYNLRLPPYYQAWGATRKSYDHVTWHGKHHGEHRRAHW